MNYYGCFPPPDDWQAQMVTQTRPSFAGPGIVDFIDAWGHAVLYRMPGRVNKDSFDVYSMGPNGRDEGGTGDDIGNWPGSWPGRDAM